MNPTLQNQHILILGLGISGLSMARWCLRLGAKVTIVDTRPAPPELSTLNDLKAEGANITFQPQAFSGDLIEGTDVRAVFKSPGLSPVATENVMLAARANGLWLGGELTLFNHALHELKMTQGYAPRVLGITGTNGKTTVTSLAGQLVERAGKTVAVAGNIGPALLDTLAACLNARDADDAPLALPEVWVLELSSFQLDGVDDFEPTAATVLNVTQDHLDWHGSMEAYAAAKENVYGKNKGETEIRVSSGLPTRIHEYGIESVAGMNWLVRAVPESDEPAPRLKKGMTAPPIPFVIQRLMPADALRIRGLHNSTNALAALALAARAGCPLAPMLYGLREYRGEPHRMESIAIHNEVEYIDDSKGTNVGATVAALTSLGTDKGGKKILVILGGDGKGQDFSPLAAPVQQFVRSAVLIGKDAAEIEMALQAILNVALHHANDLPDAVAQCANIAQSGDIVLLSPACASLDMFKDYKHRASVFVEAVHAL